MHSDYLKVGTEAFIVAGLVTTWASVVVYHAMFVWPMNIPNPSESPYSVPIAVYSSALRLAPLFDASLVLFWVGLGMIVAGSLFGFLVVKTNDKTVHAWIGLFGGICISITAWYLLGVETYSAWDRYHTKFTNNKSTPLAGSDIDQSRIHISDLSAPMISYCVLLILSTAMISRSLLRIDVDAYFGLKTAGNLWITKGLLILALFFFHIYYAIMLIAGFTAGLVCLGVVPAVLLVAYGVGRGIAYSEKKRELVGEHDADVTLVHDSDDNHHQPLLHP
jgi:hypothetical protein